MSGENKSFYGPSKATMWVFCVATLIGGYLFYRRSQNKKSSSAPSTPLVTSPNTTHLNRMPFPSSNLLKEKVSVDEKIDESKSNLFPEATDEFFQLLNKLKKKYSSSVVARLITISRANAEIPSLDINTNQNTLELLSKGCDGLCRKTKIVKLVSNLIPKLNGVNLYTEDNYTALDWIMSLDKLDESKKEGIVKLLLTRGADPFRFFGKDKDKCVFFIAAEEENDQLLKLMLEAKTCNVNILDKYSGCSALNILVSKKNPRLECINIFLQKRADPFHFYNFDGQSQCSFLLAVEDGNFELLELMLKGSKFQEIEASVTSRVSSSIVSSLSAEDLTQKEIEDIFAKALEHTLLHAQFEIAYLLLRHYPAPGRIINKETFHRLMALREIEILPAISQEAGIPEIIATLIQKVVGDVKKIKPKSHKNSVMLDKKECEQLFSNEKKVTISTALKMPMLPTHIPSQLDDFKKVRGLIANKQAERKELAKKRKDHWVKSLNFELYQRYPNQTEEHSRIIELDGESCHMSLFHQAMLTQPKREGQNHFINLSNLGINFIVSNSYTYHIQECFVLLNIKGSPYTQVIELIEEDTHKEKVAKFIEHLKSMGIEKAPFIINKQQREEYSLSSQEIEKTFIESIEEENKDSEEQLRRRFCGHSEQAGYWLLLQKEKLLEMIANLKTHLQESDLTHYRIEAIQIHIYTERYMCENCQAMAIAIQKPGGRFETLLCEAFKEVGFNKIKDQFPITVLISATKPYIPGENKEISGNEYKISSDDEDIISPIYFDLTDLPRGHIFLRDLTGLPGLDFSHFTTSFLSNLSFYKGLAAAYKPSKEKQKLEDDNKKLQAQVDQFKKEISRLKKENKQHLISPNELAMRENASSYVTITSTVCSSGFFPRDTSSLSSDSSASSSYSSSSSSLSSSPSLSILSSSNSSRASTLTGNNSASSSSSSSSSFSFDSSPPSSNPNDRSISAQTGTSLNSLPLNCE